MIRRLTGRVVECAKGALVVQCANGLGYAVEVLESDMQAQEFQTGQDVLLRICERVGEAGSRLYGFVSLEDLELFERLLRVPRLGPSGAMALLSAIPAGELQGAIARGETERLEAVKGIGAKLAKMVVVQLGEKGKKKKATADERG